MHKAFKACTAVLLALVMTVSLVNGALAAVVRNDDDTISYEPLEQGVYSKGGYTIDKVSHPTLGAGEVDGILTGDLQDRGQSYSWSMAEAGDYVYIGTCYNSTYYIYHNLSQQRQDVPGRHEEGRQAGPERGHQPGRGRFCEGHVRHGHLR